MTDVVAAREAYQAARRLVTETRLALARAIIEARKTGLTQTEIAEKLGLTREQLRRYEVEYRKFLAAQS